MKKQFLPKRKLYNLLFIFLLVISLKGFSQQHTVTGFTPTNAGVGETVTIVGTNLTSATGVSFGGVAATSFNVVSASKVTAIVASGSSSGSVSVTKSGYTTTNTSGFTFSAFPTVTGVMTDFGGFWNTNTTTNNPTYPNDSHNLLGFTYGGVSYSTGVNDSKLSSNGVQYTTGNFKALPAILNGTTSGGSLYIVAASKIDGNTAAALYTNPKIKNLTIQSVLSDGINGLDLGTGYTNLPVGATSNFSIRSILAGKITDNEPDLVITQIADPSGTATDTYKFLDAGGSVVGNQVQQDLSKISPLGTYYLDLFTVQTGISFSIAKPIGVGSSGVNTTRQIRFMAFKLSDFGITASNYSQIKTFQIIPSGVTDVAFVAYNATSINVPPSITQNTSTSNSVICSVGGGSAYLEVSASAASGGALTYVWEESTDGGTTWSAVTNGGVYSGATGNALTISSATSGFKYRATVTESGSEYSATSSVFTITTASSSALAGTLNPASFTNCLNAASGTISLSVSPTGGTGTYSYQWSSSTAVTGTYTDISGANNSIYYPSLNTAGVLYYKVKISSGCLSNLSTAATVTVNGDDILTVTNGSVCTTGTVSLSATASGGTINWYSAVSGGSSLGTGSNYTTSSISSTTTYYVGTTSGGCSSNRMPVIATVANTISLTSANFNITNATNVCVGESSLIAVSSSALSDATYTVVYSISGANTITNANATLVMSGGYGTFTTGVLSTAGSNTITISGVKINTCTISPSSGNTASIQANNGAPSVSNFSVSVNNGCSNVSSIATVSSTTMASGTYVVTYNISGTNVAASNTAQLVFTAGSPGTGSFQLPMLGTEGNSNVLNISSIALLSSPTCISTVNVSSGTFASNSTPILEIGLPIVICANNNSVNITVGASASNYSALSWTTSNGTGSFSNNTTAGALTSTTYTPSAGDIAAGSRLLTLTATANAGCNDVSKTISLTINPVSVGGSVAGSATVCTGVNSTTLTLSGNTGSITKWQYSTLSDFSSNVTDVVNSTATLAATNLISTRYYRAVITSGVCTAANSSTATITVSPSSIGGSVSGSANVCTGNNSTGLTLNGYTGNVTKWQSSTVSDFSSNVIDIANSGTALTATDLSATTYYRAVITSGACSSANSSSGIITVNPLPTASISSNNGPICTGNTSIFNLSGTSGSVLTYNINGGSNSTVTLTGGTASVSVANTASDQTLSLFSVNNPSSGCSQVLSGTSKISISTYDITVSSGLNGNVTPGTASVNCGVNKTYTINSVSGYHVADVLVDGSSVGAVTNYTFSNVTTSHTISASFAADCSDFTFTGVDNFGTSGRWTCEIAPQSAVPVKITVAGDATMTSDFTIPASGTFTIAPGGVLRIKPNVTLTIDGNANFNGQHVIIQSDSTGTGSIGQITGTLTGATNVTVERYIPVHEQRAWRLLSAPTSGQTVKDAWQEGGAPTVDAHPGYGTFITKGNGGSGNVISNPGNGFDYRTPYASLQKFNGSAWVDAISNTNTLLDTKQGYFLYIRGDRSALSSPSISTTTVSSTTLRSTGSIYQGEQVSTFSGAYGVIGNIYASAIDYNNVINGNRLSNINPNYFYVWDPSLFTDSKGVSLGGYRTMYRTGENFAVMSPIGTTSAYPNATSRIESGQAIVVATTSSTGSITFEESDKVSNSRNVFRPAGSASQIGMLSTNLWNDAGGLSDGNVVIFGSGYSNSLSETDVPKFSKDYENFSLNKSGTLLNIATRRTVSDGDTVFYDMQNVQMDKQYRLDFEGTNLASDGLTALLYDKYLGINTQIDLGITTSVNFSTSTAAPGSFARDRFSLVFKVSGTLPVGIRSLTAYQQQGLDKVVVNWKVGNETGVKGYEVERSVDGVSFTGIGNMAALNNNGAEADYNYGDAMLPTAKVVYYRVKIDLLSGTVIYSGIAKVTLGKTVSGFSIYPNPVENGEVNLLLKNVATGYYGIRILNATGQLVYSGSMEHSGGSFSKSISLSGKVGAGVYTLELLSPSGSVEKQKLVIKN